MSAVLTAAPTPVVRPVPWRRLGWVAWRRYRATVVGAALLMGLAALYVVLRGNAMMSAYQAAVTCTPQASAACHFAWDTFQSNYGTVGFFGGVLVFIPGALGAFVGAPLLAREMETGTFRYAWTQGAGRMRWLLALLVPGAVGIAAVTAAYGALITWYEQPLIGAGDAQRLHPAVFSITGVAVMGWALLAFSVGVLAGLLIRRVVPALLTTIAVWTGMAFLVSELRRYHYLEPLVTSNPMTAAADQALATWWTRGGVRVSDAQVNQVLQAIGVQTSNAGDTVAAKPGGDPNDPFQYLVSHGYTQWTSYQPDSRYWTFQAIEVTWLVLVSLLLLAATVWLVRRRGA
jgi:hypothetical protein